MRAIARSPWVRVAALAAVGALALSACSSSDSTSSESSAAAEPSTAASSAAASAAASEAPAGECTELTPVSLQLQWFVQAQFGGYYAAKDKGYYEEQCLDVTILEGGVDIVPQTVLAQGGADYAISWVPKALASRRAGCHDHQRRTGVPALRHAPGVLQGQEHHHGSRLQGQEDRQLGLRQRVRGLRGHHQGRTRPRRGRRARAASSSTCWHSSTARSTPPRP